MKKLRNQDIADILSEMAAFYEIEGVLFKPRAYERAARSVAEAADSLSELYEKGGEKALCEVPGVGKGIAEHIAALIAGKPFKEYERLRKRIPVDVRSLMRVEGIGPRTIKTLWEKLGVKTVADLKAAARSHNIAGLPHFGGKSEAKILKFIELQSESSGRQLLGSALPLARSLEEQIKKFPEVREAAVAGSVRRRKETVGDFDFLVVSKEPARTMARVKKLPEVAHVYGSGKTKTSVRLAGGLDMDVRVVPRRSWGAALNYFTGSKEHNVALRERALKRGWKLSEYGLFEKRGGRETFLAGRSEEELYQKLGLSYIPPELREMTGELEAAKRRALPALIEYGALCGDLQTHSNWTDGTATIEHMALGAEKIGLEYIAVTDHSAGLPMTGGLDGRGLSRQRKEIDEVNEKLRARGSRFAVLQGVELNIRKDGSLDLPDKALDALDLVGASVHSHFDLPRGEQMKRVLRALRHPLVQIFFHPSGRLIGRRRGIDLDWDELIAAAKETSTTLEVDSMPDRLDLRDEHVKKCVEAGVQLVIDSDAHSPADFRFLELGVAQARRGWASEEHVLNTLPLKECLRALQRKTSSTN